MPTIDSLPELIVAIAFSPSDVTSTTQSWTDVTAYVKDFQTTLGRQHYLDRIESSRLTITFDNRNGFLYNGPLNGSGQSVRVRLPIKIEARLSGGFYSVFFGAIDSLDPRLADVLNLDVTITATDKLKFLSLYNVNDSDLYRVAGLDAAPARVYEWWPLGSDTVGGTFYG